MHQREAELEAKREELARREQGVRPRAPYEATPGGVEVRQGRDLHELERVGGLTLGEARKQLLERSEDLVRHELARTVRQLEDEARTDANAGPARSSPTRAEGRCEPYRRDDRAASSSSPPTT